MARAYPKSRFFGFDFDAPSITRSPALAAETGVADRVVFAVASATGFPGGNYDLVACFDADGNRAVQRRLQPPGR
jgi:hypothetical protein